MLIQTMSISGSALKLSETKVSIVHMNSMDRRHQNASHFVLTTIKMLYDIENYAFQTKLVILEGKMHYNWALFTAFFN